jgi:DtxR family transcriptional regulator, Mn-dependent transcriptional regulator
MNHSSDLIDTTEMYLRTVFELEEEGVVPLRARIAEQLGQSVPTVSQTTARMQRDQLITFDDHRRIQLTPQGRQQAVRVMRKHRLAECLLIDVLGLEWELVHEEACRWEHVMSEGVERRLLELLGHPTHSPYGNPIPGLDELGERDGDVTAGTPVALTDLPQDAGRVVVRRIGESLQTDLTLLGNLDRAGVRPGAAVGVSWTGDRVSIGTGDVAAELDRGGAAHLFVSRA